MKRIDGKKVAVNCHRAYHKMKFGKKRLTSATVLSSPVLSMPPATQKQNRKRKRKEAPTVITNAEGTAVTTTERQGNRSKITRQMIRLDGIIRPTTARVPLCVPAVASRQDPDGDDLRPSTTSIKREGDGASI